MEERIMLIKTGKPKKHMCIPDVLDYVKQRMCDDYCRHTFTQDREKLIDGEVCIKCPLSLL